MADAPPSSYCSFVEDLPFEDLHRIYHDTQYGFPLESDDELFGRFILEINQAGLSWLTILKKQENFREAYSNFGVSQIARYEEQDIDRLLGDAGIIRNRRKIEAVIHNAQRVLELQREFGSFKEWLEAQGEISLQIWVKLFKKNFKFTGGEITREFLTSTGFIPGAHLESCPIHKVIAKIKTKSEG